MKTAKTILAGTAALAILSSAALAQGSQQGSQQDSKQGSQTGVVTKVDRIHGTVAIEQEQKGTVGANAGNADEEFKVKGGLSLDDVHAGDKVTVSIAETGGIKTITKFEKPKE